MEQENIPEAIVRGMREQPWTGEYINNFHFIICADRNERMALIRDIGLCFEGRSFSVIPSGRISDTLDSCTYIENAIIEADHLSYDLFDLIMDKTTIGGMRIVILTNDYNTNRGLREDMDTNILFKLGLQYGASTYVMYHPLGAPELSDVRASAYFSFTIDGLRSVPRELLQVDRRRVIESIFGKGVVNEFLI